MTKRASKLGRERRVGGTGGRGEDVGGVASKRIVGEYLSYRDKFHRECRILRSPRTTDQLLGRRR